ncbi:MAG: BcpO-related WXXGXW repeat protein [bacterium]|nr:BcpO-related WXXGXW repeat protein [bacterium]
MKPRDLMPSRTLRVLLLMLIFMTLALLATPRGAEAGLVIRVKAAPVKVISAPRAKTVIVAPRAPRVMVAAKPPVRHVTVAYRSGPRTVVKCGSPAPHRVWVAGHWERTGPRTSRWIPGHWKIVRRG